MESWLFAIALASSLAALAAALASFLQLRASKDANEAAVYLRLAQDYGTPEMREAIRNLAEFWRTRRDNFSDPGDAYAAEHSSNPANAYIVRGQCRMLGLYFGHAVRLYETRFISKRLLRLLVYHPGLNVYYQVVGPINASRNVNGQTQHHIRRLKGIVAQYGEGMY